MIKSEISEIKKQFTHANSTITKMCGCYVDGEKEIKTRLSESFLCLPEEETHKYFEIFKKTLSGTLGKNMINMDFPTSQEFNGGSQEFLLKLRDSQLKDELIIEEFYEKVIGLFEHVGNYLILLIHGNYDIPGKTNDQIMMEDASDEVYSYILCSICPVELSKPGLSYNQEVNEFHKRIQDWVVGLPYNGFLFPAFHDRSTDIHSLLYYSKNPEELQSGLVNDFFGCKVPLSAGGQKETFQALIEESLGEDCEYEIVKNIHENLNEMIESNKDQPEPMTLAKGEVKSLLIESGVEEEKLEKFDETYQEMAGDGGLLLASNVASTRAFEVKTPDVTIKVNPDRTDLIEQKVIDGRNCLVIEINDQIEVNGINVRTIITQNNSELV